MREARLTPVSLVTRASLVFFARGYMVGVTGFAAVAAFFLCFKNSVPTNFSYPPWGLGPDRVLETLLIFQACLQFLASLMSVAPSKT